MDCVVIMCEGRWMEANNRTSEEDIVQGVKDCINIFLRELFRAHT